VSRRGLIYLCLQLREFILVERTLSWPEVHMDQIAWRNVPHFLVVLANPSGEWVIVVDNEPKLLGADSRTRQENLRRRGRWRICHECGEEQRDQKRTQ